MNIDQLVDFLKQDSRFMDNVTYWNTIEAKDAIFAPFPNWLSEDIIKALNQKGIDKLYLHQALTLDLVKQGNNVVIVTPTASGKTLCYNLPVLNEIYNNPDARSLYLFPPKSLSQDQVSELHELITLWAKILRPIPTMEIPRSMQEKL